MRLMLANNTVECKQLVLINMKCEIRMKQSKATQRNEGEVEEHTPFLRL